MMNQKVNELFRFLMQDNELRCEAALAQFLGVPVSRVINLRRGKEEMSEEVVLKITSKTDMTAEEIWEMVS